MVILRNEALTVTVDPHGAELTSVCLRGRERLWQNENGSWAGHAPVLFPVCGATAMRLGGQLYPCPRHGFAKNALFSIPKQSEASVRLRLVSDDATMEMYPFSFCFDVVYALTPDALSIAYEIRNTGSGVLHASCGGHDSFALSGEVCEYALRFAEEERLDDFLTDANGRLTGETKRLGTGEILDLSAPFLDNGGSICLDHLRSRAVTLFIKKTGETVARMEFPETEKLVLWHPTGSRMLCIEPWQTLPDAAGETLDFPEKDGVLAVPAGTLARVTRRITYGDAM